MSASKGVSARTGVARPSSGLTANELFFDVSVERRFGPDRGSQVADETESSQNRYAKGRRQTAAELVMLGRTSFHVFILAHPVRYNKYNILIESISFLYVSSAKNRRDDIA